MYDSLTDGSGPSLTAAPHISPPFDFRSHLLLAADGRGRHGVHAHARGRHQRGGAVQTDGGQHQRRSSGFRPSAGGAAVCSRGPRGQRLDHQK